MKPCIPQANNDVVGEDYMSRGDVVNYKSWLDVRSIILVPSGISYYMHNFDEN